jgi:NADP-dependent 3-hydroxy acid dehydrogenase YdfG
LCESLRGMNGSTALVTGATSGIGKEVSRQLAALGWDVLIGARDAARGEKTAAEVAGRLLVLDVTDPVGVAAAEASVPKLDVLVQQRRYLPRKPLNNASAGGLRAAG